VIRVELKGIMPMADPNFFGAFLVDSSNSLVLPMRCSCLSVVSLQLPKESASKTPYGAIHSVLDTTGFFVESLSIAPGDRESGIPKQGGKMIIYKKTDILQEEPILVPMESENALAFHYFYQVPLYVEDSMASMMMPLSAFPAKIREAMNAGLTLILPQETLDDQVF